MITIFDSLYAGHVDMDNVGYGGTAVNDRTFSDEYLATAFDKGVAIAQTLDKNGYDTFWMAEHHFQPEGYECIPNLLMFIVHLAHMTERLKFGCGFNIAPMWHPLRLAEDFAMADWMTKGRVIFGVGRGYHTREVEAFGSPLMDQPANRELFEEQVEVIFKAFHERAFSHHGKHYDFPPKAPYRGYDLEELTLVPRPRTLPVECWQPIQGGTGRALDFMARMGIKGVIGGGSSEGGAMDGIMHGYRDALRSHGKPNAELGEDLAVGFHFFISPSVEESARIGARYYEENLKMFGPLRLTRGLTEQQIRDISNPEIAPNAGLPTIEDAIENGSVLAGPPERIIEQLKGVEERYPGLQRIQVGQPVGTPQAMMLEQLQWFAEEVMPAFKDTKVEVSVPAN